MWLGARARPKQVFGGVIFLEWLFGRLAGGARVVPSATCGNDLDSAGVEFSMGSIRVQIVAESLHSSGMNDRFRSGSCGQTRTMLGSSTKTNT
jgi:hypothetical protein